MAIHRPERISEATSELAKACDAFALPEYLEARGFERHGVEEWIRECPVCFKPKLTCRPRKRAWQCWVCARFGPADPRTGRRRVIQGAGGVLRLVQWVERCTLREAISIVFAGARLPAVPIDAIPELDLVMEVLEAVPEVQAIAPPEGAAPIPLPGLLPYLIKRDISATDVATFGLFYCAWGRYADRLVFPVWESGRLLYWQARAMWEAADRGGRFIKALNPPRVEGAAVSSELLFNIDTARGSPRVVLVEGPIDAVHVGPSAVCTFGKRITPAQIARLVRAGVRAVDLYWDGPGPKEPAGAWPEMLEAAPRLALFFDTRLGRLPHGDPGARSRDENASILARAVPAAMISRLAWI